MTGELYLVPDQPMTADYPASMVMTGKGEEMTACSTTSPCLERDVVYEEFEKLITENSNLQVGNSVDELTLRFQSQQDFSGIKRVSESSPSTEFTYPSNTYPIEENHLIPPKTIQGVIRANHEEKSEVSSQDTQYANLIEPYFRDGYYYQPTGEQLQQLTQVDHEREKVSSDNSSAQDGYSHGFQSQPNPNLYQPLNQNFAPGLDKNMYSKTYWEEQHQFPYTWGNGLTEYFRYQPQYGYQSIQNYPEAEQRPIYQEKLMNYPNQNKDESVSQGSGGEFVNMVPNGPIKPKPSITLDNSEVQIISEKGPMINIKASNTLEVQSRRPWLLPDSLKDGKNGARSELSSSNVINVSSDSPDSEEKMKTLPRIIGNMQQNARKQILNPRTNDEKPHVQFFNPIRLISSSVPLPQVPIISQILETNPKVKSSRKKDNRKISSSQEKANRKSKGSRKKDNHKKKEIVIVGERRVSLCERNIKEKFKTGLTNFSPELQFAASETCESPDSVHSGSKINSNPELVHSETQTEWKLDPNQVYFFVNNKDFKLIDQKDLIRRNEPLVEFYIEKEDNHVQRIQSLEKFDSETLTVSGVGEKELKYPEEDPGFCTSTPRNWYPELCCDLECGLSSVEHEHVSAVIKDPEQDLNPATPREIFGSMLSTIKPASTLDTEKNSSTSVNSDKERIKKKLFQIPSTEISDKDKQIVKTVVEKAKAIPSSSTGTAINNNCATDITAENATDTNDSEINASSVKTTTDAVKDVNTTATIHAESVNATAINSSTVNTTNYAKESNTTDDNDATDQVKSNSPTEINAANTITDAIIGNTTSYNAEFECLSGSMTIQGKETILEQGTQTSLEQGMETILEQGTESSLEQGTGTILEQGTETILDQGTDTILDQGTETSLEQDTKTSLEQDTETSLNQDIGTILEQGTETSLEQDTETSLDQDIGTILEQVTETSLEQGSETISKQESETILNPWESLTKKNRVSCHICTKLMHFKSLKRHLKNIHRSKKMSNEEEIGRKGNDEKEKEEKGNDEKEKEEKGNDEKEKKEKGNDEKEKEWKGNNEEEIRRKGNDDKVKERKGNFEKEDNNCVPSSSEGVGSREKFQKLGLSLQINISHTAGEKKEVKRRSSFGPPKPLRRSHVVREDYAQDPELIQHGEHADEDNSCPGDSRSEQELNHEVGRSASSGAERSGYSGADEKKEIKRRSSFGPPKPLRKRSKSVFAYHALDLELYEHQELDDEPIQGAHKVEGGVVKKRSRSLHPKSIPQGSPKGEPPGGVKKRSRSVHSKIEPRETPKVKEEPLGGVKKRSRSVHSKIEPQGSPKVEGKPLEGAKKRSRSVHPKIEPRGAPKVEDEPVEEVKKRSRTVHTDTKVPGESRKRSKTVLGFDGSASLKRMCLGSGIEQCLDQGRRRSLRLAGTRPGLKLTEN